MSIPTASELMTRAAEVRDLAIFKTVAELFPGGLENAQEYAQDTYGSIPLFFEFFTERDPSRLTGMLDSLTLVRSGLTDRLTGAIETVTADVQDWRGTAAEHFTERFLAPFEQIRLNQISLVDELNRALDASRKILEESRANAMSIADNAIDALNVVDTDSGGLGWGTVLTVVGVVAGVAATIASGNAAIGWAIVEGSAVLAGSLVDQPEASVQGASVEEIVQSMYDSLSTLRAAMADEEDLLRRALAHDLQTAWDNMDDLMPPRPYVADITPDELDQFQLPVAVTG